ncbi:MAG TPA: peroxiredoxin [Chloroflexota bacterium]|nr:peroxiredoxin [Chloroflexota bacterium]
MSENSVPQVGQQAPTFQATASTGPINLADYQGKQSVVLYFYPKADTPGCTKEACAFRDARTDLAKAGLAVVGVSADDVGAQQAFAEKYALTFPLIADTDHNVLNAYGVWGERVRPDGAKVVGVRRWSFLIDKAGTIRKVYQNVTPEEHAAEILRDAEQLGIA